MLRVVVVLLAVCGLACATGSKDPGDDTGGGVGDDTGGGPVAVTISDVQGGCSGGMCTWTVVGGPEMGTIALTIIETGDPTFEDGCTSDDVGTGGLACGVWSEYHNTFSLVDFDDASETKSIDLELVDSFTDQVGNQSTLFDLNSSTTEAQITILVEVEDPSGGAGDCAVAGDDPGFFANDCTNDIGGW